MSAALDDNAQFSHHNLYALFVFRMCYSWAFSAVPMQFYGRRIRYMMQNSSAMLLAMHTMSCMLTALGLLVSLVFNMHATTVLSGAVMSMHVGLHLTLDNCGLHKNPDGGKAHLMVQGCS